MVLTIKRSAQKKKILEVLFLLQQKNLRLCHATMIL